MDKNVGEIRAQNIYYNYQEKYKEYIIDSPYSFRLLKTIGFKFNDFCVENKNNVVEKYKSINCLECFDLLSFEELRYNDMIFLKTGNLPVQPFSLKSAFEEDESKNAFRKISENTGLFSEKISNNSLFGTSINQNNKNYPSLFGEESNKNFMDNLGSSGGLFGTNKREGLFDSPIEQSSLFQTKDKNENNLLFESKTGENNIQESIKENDNNKNINKSGNKNISKNLGLFGENDNKPNLFGIVQKSDENNSGKTIFGNINNNQKLFGNINNNQNFFGNTNNNQNLFENTNITQKDSLFDCNINSNNKKDNAVDKGSSNIFSGNKEDIKFSSSTQ